MIPDSVHPQLITLISQSFTTDEIDSIGKYLEPRFNVHLLSGEPFGITLRAELAARTIVRHFHTKNRLAELTDIVIHPESVSGIVGSNKSMNGLDQFLQKLASVGIQYDSSKRSFVKLTQDQEVDRWGYMREGENYHFAHLSIDIVGNSVLQSKYSKGQIEMVYAALLNMIQESIKRYEGRVWSWAGDGGLITFYLGNRVEDAVRAGAEIQLRMIAFNLNPSLNRFDEAIHLRIAAHDGHSAYKTNKGEILSEAINYVSHLEKKGTESDSLAVSKSVYDQLNKRVQKIFKPAGVFEGQDTFQVSFRYPWMADIF